MPVLTRCVNADSYVPELPPTCRVVGVGDIPGPCTTCVAKWQAAQRDRVNRVNAGRTNKKGKGDPRDYQGPGGTFKLHEPNTSATMEFESQ